MWFRVQIWAKNVIKLVEKIMLILWRYSLLPQIALDGIKLQHTAAADSLIASQVIPNLLTVNRKFSEFLWHQICWMRLIQLGVSQGSQSESNILSFYLCFWAGAIMDAIEKGAVIFATTQSFVPLCSRYIRNQLACIPTWDCKVTVVVHKRFELITCRRVQILAKMS